MSAVVACGVLAGLASIWWSLVTVTAHLGNIHRELCRIRRTAEQVLAGDEPA